MPEEDALARLGWDAEWSAAYLDAGAPSDAQPGRVARVDLRGGELRRDLVAVPCADPVDGARGARLVVVADDDRVVERAAGGDLGEGVSDATRTDEEDSHGGYGSRRVADCPDG